MNCPALRSQRTCLGGVAAWGLGIGMGLALSVAHADWVLPPGASVQLGGGTVSLGCTDLQLGGSLVMGGGTVSAARQVQVAAGAQWTLDSGLVELAQQWSNQGTVSVSTGRVTRVASAGCPLQGVAGLVQLSTPAPVTVPLPGGGASAQVLVSGPGACAVVPNSVQISASDPAVPSRASAPLGVLRFTATGCSNATLTVQVSYPVGSLSGLTVRKYGPHGSPSQTGWFTPPNLSISTGGGGDVLSYSVTDNGDGDNDPTLGLVADPLAPLMLPPDAGGAQAVPLLSPAVLLVLGALLAATGLAERRLRPARRDPSHRGDPI